MRFKEQSPEESIEINKYFDFYNHRRPHSKLDRMTPAQQYDNALPLPMAA
ncbi:MAG: integrase core domain-containing protein [Gammaproteobacteria bacterium]